MLYIPYKIQLETLLLTLILLLTIGMSDAQTRDQSVTQLTCTPNREAMQLMHDFDAHEMPYHDAVDSLQWSPDGRFIAASITRTPDNSDGIDWTIRVQILNVSNQQIVADLLFDPSPYSAYLTLSWSPNSRHLVALSGPGSAAREIVYIWDGGDEWTQIIEAQEYLGTFRQIAWSSDDNTFFTSSSIGGRSPLWSEYGSADVLRHWNLTTGDEIGERQIYRDIDLTQYQDQAVAALRTDDGLHLVNLETGEVMFEVTEQVSLAGWVLNKRTQLLATVDLPAGQPSSTRRLTLWNITSGHRSLVLEGGYDSVAELSQGGQYMVAQQTNRSPHEIWSIPQQRKISALIRDTSRKVDVYETIYTKAISPDEACVILTYRYDIDVGFELTDLVWDVTAAEPSSTATDFPFDISFRLSRAWSPDGRFYSFVTNEGKLYFWNRARYAAADTADE